MRWPLPPLPFFEPDEPDELCERDERPFEEPLEALPDEPDRPRVFDAVLFEALDEPARDEALLVVERCERPPALEVLFAALRPLLEPVRLRLDVLAAPLRPDALFFARDVSPDRDVERDLDAPPLERVRLALRPDELLERALDLVVAIGFCLPNKWDASHEEEVAAGNHFASAAKPVHVFDQSAG